MNKPKSTLLACLCIAAAGSAAGVMASEKDAEKPAVEVVDGAYPGEFSATALFEAAPMAREKEVISYKIQKGEKLREAMTRWADKAGYELVWQPTPEEGDIIFAANMSFTDTFEDAADSFFEVVRAQTKFDGKLHSNKVLRVFVANAKR